MISKTERLNHMKLDNEWKLDMLEKMLCKLLDLRIENEMGRAFLHLSLRKMVSDKIKVFRRPL